MKNENLLSVLEFAKLQGVSKQAIYQKLETSLKPCLVVLNGKKYIDKKKFEELQEQRESQEVKSVSSQEERKGQGDFQGDLLTFFKGQVEEKDKQIEALQNELAAANKRIADLSIELIEITKQSQELTRNTQVLLFKETEVKALPKKSIFSKIFKKKESAE